MIVEHQAETNKLEDVKNVNELTFLLFILPQVFALTHCSNVTGNVAPIEEMTVAAKQVCDAIVVVDAAQSMPHPHLRIDVSKIDVDFLAFSAHKMLGPTGVGCLYGKFTVRPTLFALYFALQQLTVMTY